MGVRQEVIKKSQKGYKASDDQLHAQIVSDNFATYSDQNFASQAALGIINYYEPLFKSPAAKLNAIKKGLASKAITDLIEITGATQMGAAHILDLTEPTLRKHIKAGKELNTGLSEHILQLFELFDKGMDTMGSLSEFKKWLQQHNIGINAKPIDLLDTITGISIIMNELLRIDYGVLA